jgi:hypothetical protein
MTPTECCARTRPKAHPPCVVIVQWGAFSIQWAGFRQSRGMKRRRADICHESASAVRRDWQAFFSSFFFLATAGPLTIALCHSSPSTSTIVQTEQAHAERSSDRCGPLMKAADLAESTFAGLRMRHSAPEDLSHMRVAASRTCESHMRVAHASRGVQHVPLF